MDAADVLDISHLAMAIIIKMSAPFLLTSLVVGVAVSLLQAVTQIQESTLSFIPKVFSILAVMFFAMPWISGWLEVLAREVFARM